MSDQDKEQEQEQEQDQYIVVDGVQFPSDANEYYDVQSAADFYNSPVPDGCIRWKCIGCYWGFDVKSEYTHAGAHCCGGCGMTLLRPLSEHSL